MSARPGTLYNWDTTSANLIAPSSGHQSAGFVTDEVPASSELNGLLQNWGAELAYLDGVIHGTFSSVIPMAPAAILQGSPVFASAVSGGTNWTGSGGSGDELLFPLDLDVGDTFTDCIVQVEIAGGSHQASFGIQSVALDGATAVVALFGQSGAGAGTYQYRFASAGGYPNVVVATAFPGSGVVVDGTKRYYLSVLLANGGASDKLYGASVTKTR